MRRILLLLLLCRTIGSLAQNTTLLQEMNALQERHKVHFLYDVRLDVHQPYRGPSLQHRKLDESLHLLFDAHHIAWKRHHHNISLHAIDVPVPIPVRYVVQGTVSDAQGEPLVCASVCNRTTGQGVLTDNRGRYVLHLSKGTYCLRASYIGGGQQEDTLYVHGDMVHHFRLNDEIELGEVTIRGDLNNSLYTTQTGRRILTADDIHSEFALLSSPDVVKTLQHQSGVSSGVELSSNLLVHGGNGDENMFLIDGAPIYQTNHSLGLFSAFNADAVKSVEFYKSGFPARYSGKVSSVTDVHTIDGDLKEPHGSFSIGLLDGRLHLSGPLDKGKTAYSLSFRRSWLDLPLRIGCALAHIGDDDKTTIYYAFRDLNARITHRLSGGHLLWTSIYWGRDSYGSNVSSRFLNNTTETDQRFRWGNLTMTLNGDFAFSDRLTATFTSFATTSYSYHKYKEDDYSTDVKGLRQLFSLDQRRTRADIYDLGLRTSFHYVPSAHHQLRFGGHATSHVFRPQTVRQSYYYNNPSAGMDSCAVNLKNKTRSMELTAYVEDEMAFTRHWSFNIGSSCTWLLTQHETYMNIDPRLAVKWQLNDHLAIKTSFTRMSQSMHRIASTFLELPTDFWVPSTARHRPVTSDQIAVGVYFQPQPKRHVFVKSSEQNRTESSYAMARKEAMKWNFSLEGYYKNTHHLLQWRNWMGVIPSAVRWDEETCEGQGRSWGLEADAAFRLSYLTATASYTLSWSRRYFPELYKDWFYDQFDNRHKLDVTLRYRFNPHLSVYAAWVCRTGNRMSLPVSYVPQPSLPGEDRYGEGGYVYDKPNNLTLPAYHRLDVGADFRSITRRGHERIWNISIYNAYCHLNTLYVDVDRQSDGTFVAHSRGYVPIVPSFSYTIKF